MQQVKSRDLLPEAFPLWYGLLGAVLVMGVGYLVENFVGVFSGREYFSSIPTVILAVALFYLVTVIGNYTRMRQREREIPLFEENVHYADTPGWFQQSISKAHSPEEARQVSTLSDIYNSIELAIEEARSALQAQVGWVHLLPVASVSVAFILALANRHSNDAYLPLEVASIAAVICVFMMFAYMSACNAMFERWKSAARYYIKGMEESRWGEFNTEVDIDNDYGEPSKKIAAGEDEVGGGIGIGNSGAQKVPPPTTPNPPVGGVSPPADPPPGNPSPPTTPPPPSPQPPKPPTQGGFPEPGGDSGGFDSLSDI